MDCWQSFELTTKTLQRIVHNLPAVKMFLDNKGKRDLFFNRFPHEQLLNFTASDDSNVMLCIKILDLFSDYDDFCSYDDRFNYALEFILINLSHISRDCQQILPFLKLLLKLLDRNNCALDSSFKNVFDRERILEVLLKLSNLKSVQKSNFVFYSSILNRVLECNFSDSLNDMVSYLFEKFKENNVMEQIVICKLILKSKFKLMSECFRNVWEWLINEGPGMLQSTDIALLEGITHCLKTFFTNWTCLKNVDKNKSAYIEKLHHNLLKVTSEICIHSCNVELKSDCKKLLKLITMKFLSDDNLACHFVHYDVLKDFDNFPDELELWPNSDNDIFFCICHICIHHSRMIWKRTKVLQAIMKCFYNKRHIIKTFVLKSIYYLYPVLTDDSDIDLVTKILGEDLLNYFSKLCSVPYLYSYTHHQLNWMLESGPRSVKYAVLLQWLTAIESNESLEEVLISTLKSCKAEMLLLQLMMENSNLGEKIGLKCAMLLGKLTNRDVSSFITLTLPFTIDKPTIFYNLLLAEPGIALNSHNSILICSLMGAVIPTLNDIQVLRGACIFSSKLLAKHKNDPRSILGFCRNVTNIRHLIDIADKVDDETGVAVIGLLKVTILVQPAMNFFTEQMLSKRRAQLKRSLESTVKQIQRNKVDLGCTLKEDFKIFIKGSSEKIRKSLRLLYHTMIYKHSIISLDAQYIIETYHMLLDYSLNLSLQAIAIQCITILLKKMPWLAQTISTSIYIEMTCLSFSDSTMKTNVFKMLDVWFMLLARERCNGFAVIPETALRSFIKRGNIPANKKQEYLYTLDNLLKRQSS